MNKFNIFSQIINIALELFIHLRMIDVVLRLLFTESNTILAKKLMKIPTEYIYIFLGSLRSIRSEEGEKMV